MPEAVGPVAGDFQVDDDVAGGLVGTVQLVNRLQIQAGLHQPVGDGRGGGVGFDVVAQPAPTDEHPASPEPTGPPRPMLPAWPLSGKATTLGGVPRGGKSRGPVRCPFPLKTSPMTRRRGLLLGMAVGYGLIAAALILGSWIALHVRLGRPAAGVVAGGVRRRLRGLPVRRVSGRQARPPHDGTPPRRPDDRGRAEADAKAGGLIVGTAAAVPSSPPLPRGKLRPRPACRTRGRPARRGDGATAT